VDPAPSQRYIEKSSANSGHTLTSTASIERSDDGESELDTDREEELADCRPLPDTESESEEEDEESIQNRFKGDVFLHFIFNR
jgi:hypothetical protein